jgi:hypothetical protein
VNNFHLQSSHLAQFNRQLSLLVQQIDGCCSETVDPTERRRLEVSAALAHDLLDKMVLAEQATASDSDVDALVTQLEARLRQGEQRIAALQAELERAAPLPRRELDTRAPSSGSTIGDAARDGFLNMG